VSAGALKQRVFRNEGLISTKRTNKSDSEGGKTCVDYDDLEKNGEGKKWAPRGLMVAGPNKPKGGSHG